MDSANLHLESDHHFFDGSTWWHDPLVDAPNFLETGDTSPNRSSCSEMSSSSQDNDGSARVIGLRPDAEDLVLESVNDQPVAEDLAIVNEEPGAEAPVPASAVFGTGGAHEDATQVFNRDQRIEAALGALEGQDEFKSFQENTRICEWPPSMSKPQTPLKIFCFWDPEAEKFVYRTDVYYAIVRSVNNQDDRPQDEIRKSLATITRTFQTFPGRLKTAFEQSKDSWTDSQARATETSRFLSLSHADGIIKPRNGAPKIPVAEYDICIYLPHDNAMLRSQLAPFVATNFMFYHNVWPDFIYDPKKKNTSNSEACRENGLGKRANLKRGGHDYEGFLATTEIFVHVSLKHKTGDNHFQPVDVGKNVVKVTNKKLRRGLCLEELDSYIPAKPAESGHGPPSPPPASMAWTQGVEGMGNNPQQQEDQQHQQHQHQ